MNTLLTRRNVIAGMGVLGLGIFVSFNSFASTFKNGWDLRGQTRGRSFTLNDTQGNQKTLSSYQGSVAMIFFGFTQCPAVCPITLSKAAKIKKLLGPDGDRLKVVFITLDPERDTPAVLDAYVKTFDPTFEALYGSLEVTAATAAEFGVIYEKVPLGETYTISHTAMSYVYDSKGTLCLGLSQSLTEQECAEDLLTVMKVS
ncbi:SCO1/SenC/PrrC protein, involved in biogenesis of respiratory and photosynthetic system [Pseudomonas sp. GM79]|jgi:protein SCO1/2|uniref:SCO family protein n=1 Tax=Pseudomonas TaxID=286 RepID=UPI00026F61C4|nr:SCO family protein [Pseudomonas sp. GM79]EJN23833.1 SCO1/SenC/PrrC protein, involved in biogenesis of respiratory and photosynthetic system [Pseudomonas sp. GM79]